MRRAPTPFESLQADAEVMDELKNLTASRRKFPREEHVMGGKRAIAEALSSPPLTEMPVDAQARLPEAIILSTGRPTLLITGGSFEEPQLETWRTRLAPYRSRIDGVIPSVGRVEVLRHPDYQWLGTAWVVDEKVLVTNRHVAAEFARKQGGGFAFLRNPFGEEIGARVDFHEEFRGTEPFEVAVEKVLFIADAIASQPDMALILLASHDGFPAPIALAGTDPRPSDTVAVIGYPAFDTRNDGPTMSRLFQDIYDVKRMAPGYVTGADDALLFQHDCTTLGGNSGSPVINIATGEAAGLHFSGRFGVANFAVKASAVKAVLARAGRVSVTGTAIGVPVEAQARPEDYADRKGYDEKFLGNAAKLRVPMPELGSELLDDAVEVGTGRGLSRYVLDYAHFSIVMCRSRRGAFYTAVNIDGSAEFAVGSRRPQWIFDPRIPRSLQVGDEVYAGRNKVDRGHLVRRLDPVWGDEAIAIQAHRDTFHFTNALPQQHTFNDGDWGDLEDYLLFGANNDDNRLTLFTGPVFRASDLEWRGVQIPEEFWKVATLKGPSGNLVATAYLVSQRPYLDDLEFVPGRFRNYQVAISRIEELTSLNFGKLKDVDPLGGTESFGGPAMRVLDGPADIVL